MKKINTVIMIMVCVFCAQSHGQMIISAGANGYLAEDFMFGLGVGFEMTIAEGCFSGDDGATTMGMGIEYLFVPLDDGTTGDGFVFPFFGKERVRIEHNFAFDVGLGGALVMLDVEDGYMEMGGAVLAEVGLLYLMDINFTLAGAIRGGVLFLADEVFPFIGVKVHIGYFLYFADEDDGYDY
ncbi:MAG: hypothetical protein JW822_07540 [Spirochaetales bacterium]|nr:hypothetical protein [Spirochaetales bacterium]